VFCFSDIALPLSFDESVNDDRVAFYVGVHVPFTDIGIVLDAADRAGYYNAFVIAVVDTRWKPTLRGSSDLSRVHNRLS